jgi:hypothetical protein
MPRYMEGYKYEPVAPNPVVRHEVMNPAHAMGRPSNIRVHLANEHGIDPDTAPRGYDVEHWSAHTHGTFREDQFHYHTVT